MDAQSPKGKTSTNAQGKNNAPSIKSHKKALTKTNDIIADGDNSFFYFLSDKWNHF